MGVVCKRVTDGKQEMEMCTLFVLDPWTKYHHVRTYIIQGECKASLLFPKSVKIWESIGSHVIYTVPPQFSLMNE